jgi:hypothetical protein
MPALELNRCGDHFCFDDDQSYDMAKSLASKCNSAEPFPHIVLDNFMPAGVTKQLLHNFFSTQECSVLRTTSYTSNERGYRPDDPRNKICRNCLYTSDISCLLQFLEKLLTGIEGLICGPHFFAVGLHGTGHGGKPGLQVDFNPHPRLGLIRRINVLLYLNQEWQPDYGGYLELWRSYMSLWVKSIEQRFNRCVMFNTYKDSFHGQPVPESIC